MQAKQPFDPVGSFNPVALLGRSPMVVAVAPKHVTVTQPADLVALAKTGDTLLTYGTAGSGSINHIGAELLRMATGMKLSQLCSNETRSE